MAELDNFQDEPWQRVTHTYHERRYIFMALYVEMHQLTWFKQNERRPRKILANPEPFMFN